MFTQTGTATRISTGRRVAAVAGAGLFALTLLGAGASVGAPHPDAHPASVESAFRFEIGGLPDGR